MTDHSETHINHMSDIDEALCEIRGLNRRVVTFSGFSSAGYEDQHAVEQMLSGWLDTLDPLADIVCSGATPMGIGALYALASSRGFQTIGIVSSNAVKEQVKFAKDVKTVFVIEDDRWGGYIEKTHTPSPTSRVMVEASDVLIFIGGGDIARDEYDYAKRLGKQLHFEAADMNHNLSMDKARRKGEPAPSNFKGSLYQYLEARKK
ncbi:hypothetical protein [Paraburkholderia hospita]|uniref:hypothetical protein n=1 Tax=Paraburkholderia hospita TaxID=169430 RepID=UPI000B34594F|nr:hypothetical protein [Paraburkholderia hospita]OUL96714.1 hypothetical protein CA603_04605 [Paraburkholderia hospita]